MPGGAAQMRAGRRALRSSPRLFRHATLSDGSDYLWWPRLFEFLISADGRRILYRCLDPRRREAFHTYLLGHALSFALIKSGAEPIHGTAVDVGPGAIVFLGDTGYGKSTLAAAFVAAGDRILTDDLLVLSSNGAGFKGYPGPPRIKLMENLAQRALPGVPAAGPMNRRGSKLIIPLGRRHAVDRKARILAFYDLLPPEKARNKQDSMSIQPLSTREAFMALTRNTFNPRVATPERLRQLFALTTAVAASVPVKRLSYPRTLEILPTVRKRVLDDVRQTQRSMGKGGRER